MNRAPTPAVSSGTARCSSPALSPVEVEDTEMAKWIGEKWIGGGWADRHEIGQVGFLIEIIPQGCADHWELSDLPGRTNMSHEPRLDAWLGETNNVNRYAHGIVRVTRIARNGRALVIQLTGDDVTAALEELGFPELEDA